MTYDERKHRANRLAKELISNAPKSTGQILIELFARTEKMLPFLAEHADEDVFISVLANVLARPAVVNKHVDILIRHYPTMRELFQGSGTQESYQILGLIENDLGLARLDARDFDGATTHFRESLACDERAGDVTGRLDSLWNLTLAHRGAERYDEALACCDRALESYPADAEQTLRARFHYSRGCSLASLGRAGEARSALETALVESARLNYGAGVEVSVQRLVEVCADLDDRPAAKRYIELSMRIALGLPVEVLVGSK